QPPYLPCVQKRHTDHDHDRRQHENDLARDEVKTFKADTLRHGGACGKGEDDTKAQQHQEGRKKPAVDRPPPCGDRAAIGAADHGFVPPIGSTPSRPRTISRNASPLTSKFLNWSKLAQAGDRRMTASPPVSREASCVACSTATATVPELS